MDPATMDTTDPDEEPIPNAKTKGKRRYGIYTFRNEYRINQERIQGIALTKEDVQKLGNAEWGKLTVAEKEVYHNRWEMEKKAKSKELITDVTKESNADTELLTSYPASSKRKAQVISHQNKPLGPPVMKKMKLSSLQVKKVESVRHDVLKLLVAQFGGIKLESGNVLMYPTTIPKLLSFIFEWREEKRRDNNFPGPDPETLTYINDTMKALIKSVEDTVENTNELDGQIVDDQSAFTVTDTENIPENVSFSLRNDAEVDLSLDHESDPENESFVHTFHSDTVEDNWNDDYPEVPDFVVNDEDQTYETVEDNIFLNL